MSEIAMKKDEKAFVTVLQANVGDTDAGRERRCRACGGERGMVVWLVTCQKRLCPYLMMACGGWKWYNWQTEKILIWVPERMECKMGEGKNMNINGAEMYLQKNGKKLLGGGKSGARVYDIGGEYVLKQIYRAELGNDELYEAYRKEAWWYAAGGAGLSCLPEGLDLRSTGDEIAILLKRYDALPRQEINENLLGKIMRSLALVHTSEIPPLLMREQHTAQLLSEGQIRDSVDGWCSVLEEHPGVFDGAPLECIAGEINRIISWHGSEEVVLNHGDFHWDNLLMDDQGRILICDWQGVGAGAASGDLSFFFGRLRGDGIQVNEQEVVETYGREVSRISGKRVIWEEVCGHIRAANVITSFTCWHQYLHGGSEGRVREIYGKMVADSAGIW